MTCDLHGKLKFHSLRGDNRRTETQHWRKKQVLQHFYFKGENLTAFLCLKLYVIYFD